MPRLFVVSGPSGVGKSTILRKLIRMVAGLRFAVSHTTRPRRCGEVQGRDYHFVSDPEFDRLAAEGAFVEWAVVHGRRYGTSREAVRSASAGEDLIIEVDVQGAQALRRELPSAVAIFIAPPAFEDLRTRLAGRGRESWQEVERRLRTAEREMPRADRYDHLLVNDDLGRTVRELAAIIRRERGEAPPPPSGEPAGPPSR